MRHKLTRRQVLEKCVALFEALRRYQSKGNAGLEPEIGAEEQYYLDDDICQTLREMIREMMTGEQKAEEEEQARKVVVELRDWQKVIMENGVQEHLTL